MPKKKKEEITEETNLEATTEEAVEETVVEEAAAAESKSETKTEEPKKAQVVSEEAEKTEKASGRGNRASRVGIVTSDKMEKTVVVRVDRLVKHPKYRKYVRRRKKFMAHDDLASSIGDKVKIVETRPLSARKRWRVVEIIQKAAK